MHGVALNITIQSYAGHVDFGIVADKKALPHANDLAKSIEAAFKEAQTVFSSAADAEADVFSGKTPGAHVPKVTKQPQSEKPPPVTRLARRDTVSVTHHA